MTFAIRIERLSKRYRLSGTPRCRYRTVRESVTGALAAPWRKWRRWRNGEALSEPAEYLWALRDLSFEVSPGEVVGVIGPNGAGKSTLLKILSRITDPTTGRAELLGRVGSLLEVGTGFHAELTGRENIYLNGAILGMSRREITRKFDTIVEFAEIDRFLDTPVKHYSSGMRMRLAFAVAAHLDPEILLLDEVLAVGDASFQRRCIEKMQDVGAGGCTVLFVSHQMAAITRLCRRALWLRDGSVYRDGPATAVVQEYLGVGLGLAGERVWHEAAPGNDVVRLRAVRARMPDGRPSSAMDIRLPIALEMEYEVLEGGYVLVPSYHFVNEEGVLAFIVNDQDPTWRRRPRPAGAYLSRAIIPGNLLAEGIWLIGAALSTHDPFVVHCFERDTVSFQVVDSYAGDSARGDLVGAMPGVVRPLVPWSTQSTLSAVVQTVARTRAGTRVMFPLSR